MRKAVSYIGDSLRTSGIRGLLNLYKAYSTLKNKPSKVMDEPLFLLIEPTTNCNLKCKMCARTDLNRASGNLNFKEYRKIINQFDSITNLCLTGLGEPFLNSDIFEMIRFAKKNKKISYVWLSTNGQALNEQAGEEIIKTGLDSLYISLDGASASLYEKIRKGAKFDTVTGNIKALAKAKKQCRNDINIKIVFTVMADNFFDLCDMVKLASGLGADDLLISPVNSDFVKRPELKAGLSNLKDRELIYLSKSHKIHIEYADYNDCFEPWVRPYITWDGYVTPCAVRPEPAEINFGNIFEEPFKKIWNNEKFKQFRASFRKPEICRQCPRKWK